MFMPSVHHDQIGLFGREQGNPPLEPVRGPKNAPKDGGFLDVPGS